jgi:nitroreductase
MRLLTFQINVGSQKPGALLDDNSARLPDLRHFASRNILRASGNLTSGIATASVVTFRSVTPRSLIIGPLTDGVPASLTPRYPNFSSVLKSVPNRWAWRIELPEVTAETTDIFEIMHTMRAMRRLKPDPVPDELIRKILLAGQAAANGGNTQRWRFLVLKDHPGKKVVQGYYKKLFDEVVGPRYRNSTPPPGSDQSKQLRQMAANQYLTDHYHEAPVWIVACLEGDNPGYSSGASDMRRSATKRWASRRTTIPTRSCRSDTRWGDSDRLAAGHYPKSSISTAGARPIPEFNRSRFGTKAWSGQTPTP